MLKRIVVLVLFCFIIINNVHSQVEKIVVDDIEMAYLSFDDKEDSSAFEYFTTRQKKYPKDPVYNYYAGACYLFVKDKPEKAVDYLRFASTQNVPSDVFFFLAKAYHLNYEFDNAIKYYNRFKYNATRKQIKKYDLLNNIRKAENGKYLIQNVFLHELISVENKNIKSLYRNYNSKYVSGEFLLVNDFVENESIDSNNLSVIYKGKNIKENEVFYFSMPNKKDGDKDIFSLVRINDTTWSKPQNLGDIINTDFDEEYPYIHTDGTTLFFASKGHYSM
ncbi:MAG: hypothetical protein U9R54_02220, partial [Bacteroidota bacterium]|nr:hypothetical protein [Bacteroidota bacterium]